MGTGSIFINPSFELGYSGQLLASGSVLEIRIHEKGEQ
jgi:hypothetical protein